MTYAEPHQTEPIDLEDLLPVPDGAKLIHSAVSTLRGHLSAGRLTRYYVGRRVLVSRRQLAEFVRIGQKPLTEDAAA